MFMDLLKAVVNHQNNEFINVIFVHRLSFLTLFDSRENLFALYGIFLSSHFAATHIHSPTHMASKRAVARRSAFWITMKTIDSAP